VSSKPATPPPNYTASTVPTAISAQSAEAIAQAAQAFGHDGDITVLTLTFASQPVLLA
jgi:hypothetical protein